MSGADLVGTPVRLGTRGSALALAQARLATAALESAGAPVELVVVQTAGDRRAADTPWGEGAFVGALEDALLRDEIDLAVHSAKDMPTQEDARLRVVAYLRRADPRDALVVAAGRPPTTLDELPASSTIGTDSPRRTGFLRARRPDLKVQPLHGNVDTRLRRLDEGEVDALVLACAGLDRIERGGRISQRLAPTELPPAPGQGAIALQARAGDARMAGLGTAVDEPATRVAVEAERALLAATGGGCRAPIGALATVDGEELTLLAGFATPDGQRSAVEQGSGPLADAAIIAGQLARSLVARRAELAGGARVLVTRPADQSARLVGRLAEQGLGAVIVPTIEVRPLPDGPLIDELRRQSKRGWVVLTSANAARAVGDAAARANVDLAGRRWAAVGRQTAAALRLPPGATVWLPSQPRAETLAGELPLEAGTDVLLPRGSLADESLPTALRARGATVREVVVYETVEAPATSRPLLAQALDEGSLGAIMLASPSAVRGLLALASADEAAAFLALPAVCVGPVTAAAARAAGFGKVVEAPGANAEALAEAAAELLATRPLEVPV